MRERTRVGRERGEHGGGEEQGRGAIRGEEGGLTLDAGARSSLVLHRCRGGGGERRSEVTLGHRRYYNLSHSELSEICTYVCRYIKGSIYIDLISYDI